MKKMNKKAFTLIELLIVIAIIGILFIVLVSKVDFATDKAKATGVQTDFRSFQMAFEQVAKENAGFTTFGWDTGDTFMGDAAFKAKYGEKTPDGQNYTFAALANDTADNVRNSYDAGDANLDGEKQSSEIWTGRKVYTEEWTGIWTLVKPGTAAPASGEHYKYDTDRIFALESAINKNLDPKLHITIATDGTITMANQARDPWKVEYVGKYITNASAISTTNTVTANKAVADYDHDNDNTTDPLTKSDKSLDRGAIIMYSKGANGKLGCVEEVVNGEVVVTVLTAEAAGSANTADNNVAGKDDYSIATIYTFKNGYGEVISSTTGFSSNQ